MIHLYPNRLIAVVESLKLNEQAIYYIGALSIDGSTKEDRKMISSTGIIAWDLYEVGIISLKNRRIQEGEYEYILVKEIDRKIPLEIVKKANQLQERYDASTKLT